MTVFSFKSVWIASDATISDPIRGMCGHSQHTSGHLLVCFFWEFVFEFVGTPDQLVQINKILETVTQDELNALFASVPGIDMLSLPQYIQLVVDPSNFWAALFLKILCALTGQAQNQKKPFEIPSRKSGAHVDTTKNEATWRKVHFVVERRVFVVWCSYGAHSRDFCLYLPEKVKFLQNSRYLHTRIAPKVLPWCRKKRARLKTQENSTSLPPIPSNFFLETFYISTKLRKQF